MTGRTVPTDWTESVERRRWEAEETESKVNDDPFIRALLEALNDPEVIAEARRAASMRRHPSSQVDSACRPVDDNKPIEPMEAA